MNEWTRRLCFGLVVVVFCSVCSTSGQNEHRRSSAGVFRAAHPTGKLNAPRLYAYPFHTKSPTVHPVSVPRVRICSRSLTGYQPFTLSRSHASFQAFNTYLFPLDSFSLHSLNTHCITSHPRHHVLHHPVHHQRHPLPRPRQAAHLLGRRRGHLQCGPDAYHQGRSGCVVSIRCTRLIPGLRPRREGSRIHVRKTCSSLSSERRSSAAVLTPPSSGAFCRHTRWSGRADKSTVMSRWATSFLQEVEPPSPVWLSSPLVSPTRESLSPSHLAPK